MLGAQAGFVARDHRRVCARADPSVVLVAHVSPRSMPMVRVRAVPHNVLVWGVCDPASRGSWPSVRAGVRVYLCARTLCVLPECVLSRRVCVCAVLCCVC